MILFGLELAALRSSDTPGLSAMRSDLGGVLGGTNLALVVFPFLLGLATVVGLFVVPMLPLPEVVPFA